MWRARESRRASLRASMRTARRRWQRSLDRSGGAMKRSAVPAIVDAEIRAYEADGAICLRGVIDADWLARLEGAARGDLRPPREHHRGSARKGQLEPDVRDYVFASPLPELASILMRSRKVNLLYDQIFVKEPGTD